MVRNLLGFAFQMHGCASTQREEGWSKNGPVGVHSRTTTRISLGNYLVLAFPFHPGIHIPNPGDRLTWRPWTWFELNCQPGHNTSPAVRLR